LMGGELSVQSVMGQGSTFSVRMYLREIACPPEHQEGSPAYRAERLLHRPITGYVGPRKTLLVVDDQPIQRQMLAGMLLPLGFDIREAASGSEGLESVREACPDAVLLDITMDDMDGWRTARSIRQAGFTDVPIIMVSANVFENRPENLAAAQCQAFVGKPVMESELLDTLARHLRLQWVADTARLPLMERPPETFEPLPADAAWELERLARKGHVQALQAALEDWTRAAPEHASHWRLLRQQIDQFELDAVAAHLAPYLNEDPLDEPEPQT
jgi:CheY-like chemotaxis protein